jgi:hypothetical protein
MPRVVIRPYTQRSDPPRLAVGDIIRCPAFEFGFCFFDNPTEVMVAWRNLSFPDYPATVGNGTLAHDPTRGLALFLVTSIELIESTGPDDSFPGNHRLARDVRCLRLTDDGSFTADAERIHFMLNEPMCVAQPDEDDLEVVGYAELPINWEEPT